MGTTEVRLPERNELRCVAVVTYSVLPCRAAGIGIAIPADGSWFVDVEAKHPVNHFSISLPPAAKPCVLFSWNQYNISNY